MDHYVYIKILTNICFLKYCRILPCVCPGFGGIMRQIITFLAMTFLLASCGGGGGSDASPPSNTLPIAGFSFNPQTGNAPLTVSFDASTSSDNDGSITSYSWNFADGSDPATGITVEHTYSAGGTGSYEVELTVTDNDNATASKKQELIVNEPPRVTFKMTPNLGNAPLPVTFDGTESVDVDGQITDYEWNFGDGSIPVSGSVVQHVYENAGSYTVQLHLTDDDQASASAAHSIVVNPPLDSASVAGTIGILSSSVYDADVNDWFAPFTRNNHISTAQSIPNPATIGGFVNEKSTGPISIGPGRLHDIGDDYDVYRVELYADENILLYTSDISVGDLDLYLFDKDINLVDSSAGLENTESILSTYTGTHYIVVTPWWGYGNYILNLGRNISGLGLSQARLSDHFVPGEALIERKTSLSFPSAFSVNKGRIRELRKIDSPETLISTQSTSSGRQHPLTHLNEKLGGKINPQLVEKFNTLLYLKELKSSDPSVISAEPNFILNSHSHSPNDPYYQYQWHYPSINLPDAWHETTGDRDIIVAIVDTGVLLSHPDLQAQLVTGYDFISSLSRSADGDGIDPDPNDSGDKLDGEFRSSFHGTHVAGTVAATSENSTGVSGVAGGSGTGVDGVSIMPLRALGKGGGTTYDICQSLLYAAGLPNDSGTVPSSKADVINMSLGGPSWTSYCNNVISEILATGTIIIASAGNDETHLPSYPAAVEGVVSVSATNLTNGLSYYSNFGSTIDVAAPGGDMRTDLNSDGNPDGILSTLGDDSGSSVNYTYGINQGTSMAAPHVAGVAALMKSIYPDLTPAQFQSALASMELTDDLGTSGWDNQFGYGLINARKAVVKALELANSEAQPIDAVLKSSLDVISFDLILNQVQLALSNPGNDLLEVTDIFVSQPWLSVTSVNTDAQGLGTYSVLVDRGHLSLMGEGTYASQILVQSTVNNISIPVSIRVAGIEGNQANAGLHYVLVVDPDTYQTVEWIEASLNQGAYTYKLNDVPGGSYLVVAGTDTNYDGYICDSGEACGVYGTLDSPKLVYVNADQDNIDFQSGYRVNLYGSSQEGASLSSISVDKISVFGPLRLPEDVAPK